MSRAARRRESCGRKSRYASKAAARSSMSRMIRQTGASPSRMHVYSCGKGVGKHWHFGHKDWRYA